MTDQSDTTAAVDTGSASCDHGTMADLVMLSNHVESFFAHLFHMAIKDLHDELTRIKLELHGVLGTTPPVTAAPAAAADEKAAAEASPAAPTPGEGEAAAPAAAE